MLGNQNQHNGTLESWKEIAEHVGRDIRTAMRWAEHGMPVHRVPGGKRGRVFAYAQEIDDWLAGAGTPDSGSGVGETEAGRRESGVGSPAAGNGGQATGTRVQAGVARDSLPLTQRLPLLLRRRWQLGGLILTVMIIAAVLVTRYMVWSAPVPESFEIQGKSLIVYDASHRQLWEHTFEYSLNQHIYGLHETKPEAQKARLEDLDRDSKPEMLLIPYPVGPVEAVASRYLACFDSVGRKRWEYRPTQIMRFGDDTYDPPYSVDFFQVSQAPHGGPRPVWAVAHHAPWWPGVVAKLDPSGRVLAEYWHHGHITVLAEATLGGRRVLLAGGTNQETSSAALSVLDFDSPGGSAPATQEQYRCQNCPPGAPLAYLVFPRAPLGRVLNSRSYVEQIWVRQDGDVEVVVQEGDTSSGVSATVSYNLDAKFRLQTAEVLDEYVSEYDTLLARGVLNKPLDRAREDAGLRDIRYWDGSKFTTTWQP